MSKESEIKGPKNNWPHKFVKSGDEELIRPPGGQFSDYIKVVPMICVCCQVQYVQGKDAQPPSPCPARTDKSELRRLHNGG